VAAVHKLVEPVIGTRRVLGRHAHGHHIASRINALCRKWHLAPITQVYQTRPLILQRRPEINDPNNQAQEAGIFSEISLKRKEDIWLQGGEVVAQYLGG